MAEYRREWVRDADARFAQRVKAERERRRISQTQIVTALAADHGVRWHQSTMTKVEAGERPVRLMEALAVASVLGVPLEDLLDDPGSAPARRRRAERLHGRDAELLELAVYLARRRHDVDDELAEFDDDPDTDDEQEDGPRGEHRPAT